MTQTLSMTPQERNKAVTRAVFSGVVGSALEWYDFVLFSSASALVFNVLFFPKLNPLLGTAAALMANSVAFALRPLGGIVFGSLGDRIGRKRVMTVTLLLMGISTTLIGVLPTYNQVGVLAPVLLLVLRACEGLAVGAEFSGASVMVSEFSTRRRQGLLTSLTGAGNSIGIALASLIFSAVSSLPKAQFLSWGWRIPFLLSVIGIGIGMYVRMKVMETPEFKAVTKKTEVKERAPIRDIVTQHTRSWGLGTLACFSENATTNLVKTFALAYLVSFLKVGSSVGLNAILWASLFSLIVYPLCGVAADRFGFKKVYLTSAVLVGVFVFPFFWMLNTKNTFAIIAAIVLMYAVMVRGMSATQGAFLSNQFPTRVRYTGVASAREVASAFSGGLSPVLGTWLLAVTNSWVPVAAFMVAMAAISAIATQLLGNGKYPPDDVAVQTMTQEPVDAVV